MNWKRIAQAVGIVLLIKAGTWSAGYALARWGAEFDRDFYFGFHHLDIDLRAPVEPERRAVEFLNLWNYADSEWYLAIARHGYPTREHFRKVFGDGTRYPYFETGGRKYLIWHTEVNCDRRYAFFPLYPLTIRFAAQLMGFRAGAFVVTLLFSLAAAACFIVLFDKTFPDKPAEGLWAVALLFLYPFSLYYNLYYTESLFLLLSLVVFLALHSRRDGLAAAAGFLMGLTRPNGVFIVFPALWALYERHRSEPRLGWPRSAKSFVAILAIPLGLVPYIWLNFVRMGDWKFFSTVQQLWGYQTASVFGNFWHNTWVKTLQLHRMHFHSIESSQVDFIVMAAGDEAELVHMVATAAAIDDRPCAFRYPRGEGLGVPLPAEGKPLEIGKGRILREGSKVALFNFGGRLGECLKAADELAALGLSATVADARFAKPLDVDLLLRLAREHEVLITIEEGSIGGFGSYVLNALAEHGLLDRGMKVRSMVLPDIFIDHDTPAAMYARAGLDAKGIVAKVFEALGKEAAVESVKLA